MDIQPPKCPTCERVLFNRMRDYCMWCGAELPEALRLSETDKQALREKQENEEKEIEDRRRKAGDDKDSSQWVDGNALWWGNVTGGSGNTGGDDC